MATVVEPSLTAGDEVGGVLSDVGAVSAAKAADRQAMLALVDRLLADARAQLDDAEDLTDLMIDCDTLRRWFTAELWADTEPTWFTNTGPGIRDEPAVIGIDDHVIAILWLP